MFPNSLHLPSVCIYWQLLQKSPGYIRDRELSYSVNLTKFQPCVRVLGTGTKTPPRLQIAQDLVGETENGIVEHWGQIWLFQELGFVINTGPHI